MQALILLVGNFLLGREVLLVKKEIAKILKSKQYIIAQNNFLLSALVAGEDRRFFEHHGYDPIAITRAIRNKLLHNRTEGASTIEQQLVRTIIGNYEKTLSRKVKEILIARTLKYSFSKHEIAYSYISTAYYGWSMNNIQQAYRRLNLNNISMTRLQAAKLIARLRYPEPKIPNKERKQRILSRARYIMSLQKSSPSKETKRVSNAAI